MNRLKELRKEKGLSQQALANELGVHYRTLQNWENGKSNIKPEKAELLADYFGVSVPYLLGYDTKTLANKQQLYLQKLKSIALDPKPEKFEEQMAELKNILPASDKGRLKYGNYLSDDKITEYEKKVYEKYQRIGKQENVTLSVPDLSSVGISQKEYIQRSTDILAETEIANFFASLTYLTDLELPALIYFSALKKDTQKSLLNILKTLAENNTNTPPDND
ncbi:helix-turn-helix domain-containing protein [Streptococcus infantarius]|uniref:helix-turn-helix domain-containing protein n=1 Tax=Streptococcus infantarius TaxID=102684 RepID=UPI0022E6A72F|nr:helix-turn-helix transcriptional regulator [Streptococcus infantarius]